MQMRKVLIIVLFISQSTFSSAQNLEALDSMSTLEAIDTLFIDHDLNNWSFRLYSSLKEQRLKISNGISSVSLIPNNPYGIGFGIATKKLLLDIGFNIKPDNEHTERFDLQGSFMYRHDQVGFFLQHYKGFNVRNNASESSYFRDDIKLQSAGIRYLYMFNSNEYSFSSVKTGLARQKKSSYSFGVGGFILQTNQRADSSFVNNEIEPSFNDQALIVNSYSIGIGSSLGFSALIVLPNNFFIGLGCSAGLGVNYNKIYTEEASYATGNPLVYQLGLVGDLGYNNDKIYVNFSINNNLYTTDLDFGNWGTYNQINAKLAIGFKYGRNKNIEHE